MLLSFFQFSFAKISWPWLEKLDHSWLPRSYHALPNDILCPNLGVGIAKPRIFVNSHWGKEVRHPVNYFFELCLLELFKMFLKVRISSRSAEPNLWNSSSPCNTSQLYLRFSQVWIFRNSISLWNLFEIYSDMNCKVDICFVHHLEYSH